MSEIESFKVDIDRFSHTNFSALKALFHLSHPENLVDDLHMRRMLQAPLGVTSDFLELIGSDAIPSKLTDDVKQKLNAV